ncbi:hypothetical protein ABIB73_003699 [Bradyrhizobium sp. F1.4.3]|uniref:hypothetical protein n=1 Tax=Bradyrhizobium sp. F1.4.3 TaxID=3156356 RepID=UPI00339104F2
MVDRRAAFSLHNVALGVSGFKDQQPLSKPQRLQRASAAQGLTIRFPLKQFGQPVKPFRPSAKPAWNGVGLRIAPRPKQWGSVMSALINILYREFCLIRIEEMRKV